MTEKPYREVFLAIGASNIREAIDFYTQFFGHQPQKVIPDVYAEFHCQGMRLGIFQPQANHREEFANSTRSSMSICVEVDNLETAIARLQTIGYPPTGQIVRASHGREIYARDPLGNRLILHESP